MSNTRTVRVAQIGCGYWGPNLLRNLAGIPTCEVGLVVEASGERRNYVAQNFSNVPTGAEAEAAFTDSSIEACVIATPARTHFELAKRALEHGKHIFVEKPLAMTVAEVDALAALARPRGLVVMAGHTFLYNAAVRHLRELIVSGELGRIFCIYSQRLNLGILRSDINVMWNLAPHDIAILCYLLGGPPASVSAVGTDFIQPGIEDVVFMDMEWPDRVRGHVHVSWLDPNKIRSVTVVGSRKMAVYDDVAKDKIAIYDKGIDLVQDANQGMPYDRPSANRPVHRSGQVVFPELDYPEPLRTEMDHFFDCVRTGNEPLTGLTHAREVVRILELGEQSLAARRR